MAALDITRVQGEEEFLALRDEWNRLLADSEANGVFLTWEWIFNWWRFFGRGKTLLLFTIREDSELVGIAPFYVTRTRSFSLRPLHQIEFIGSPEACSEYLDLIVRRGREQEVVRAFLDHLFSRRDVRWDVVNLLSVREKSQSLEALRDYMRGRQVRCEQYGSRESPFIALPPTMEEYLKGLSGNARRRLKKAQTKIQQGHSLALHRVSRRSELEVGFNTFAALHQQRWVAGNGQGSFSQTNEGYGGFHRTIAPCFLDNGWLYLVELKVDEQVVGALYCFAYNNILYGYSMGFDSAWRDYSIGTLILLMTIENVVTQHFTEFDFLRGGEEYKYYWTKTIRTSVDTVVWRSSVDYKLYRIEKGVRRTVNRLLPKKLAVRIYDRLLGPKSPGPSVTATSPNDDAHAE